MIGNDKNIHNDLFPLKKMIGQSFTVTKALLYFYTPILCYSPTSIVVGM